MNAHILTTKTIETPLGEMIAIADEKLLYLLEFKECRGLQREVERLQKSFNASFAPGVTAPIASIQAELALYFGGELREFKTPLFLMGTSFQKQVWHELQRIPYGQTRSYSEQAAAIGRPTACRAVANANGANQLALIIPCHRIIAASGKLGGYGGCVWRKQWLIEHERRGSKVSSLL